MTEALQLQDEQLSIVPNRATLYKSMAKVMAGIQRVPKNGTHPTQGYKFATEGDIVDTVRTLLAENNIAFIPEMTDMNVEPLQDRKGTTFYRYAGIFRFTFACGETGAAISSMWHGEAFDYQDKGINKCATSAEKYFLLKTFMISTGDTADDPDSHNIPAAVPASKDNATLIEERDRMFQSARTHLAPDITDREICELADVADMNDFGPSGWGQYKDLKAAWHHIYAAFNEREAGKDTPPAQPQAAQSNTAFDEGGAGTVEPPEDTGEVVPAVALSVTVKTGRNDKPYYSLRADIDGVGERTVNVFSREKFVEAGWIADDDWELETDDKLKLDTPIPVQVVQNGKFWNIHSVATCDRSTDALDADGYADLKHVDPADVPF